LPPPAVDDATFHNSVKKLACREKIKDEAARVRAASVVVGFSDNANGGASDATVASHAF